MVILNFPLLILDLCETKAIEKETDDARERMSAMLKKKLLEVKSNHDSSARKSLDFDIKVKEVTGIEKIETINVKEKKQSQNNVISVLPLFFSNY